MPSLSTAGTIHRRSGVTYYEQGYNNQDYQYQPPAED
jgi:hypothetical protein